MDGGDWFHITRCSWERIFMSLFAEESKVEQRQPFPVCHDEVVRCTRQISISSASTLFWMRRRSTTDNQFAIEFKPWTDEKTIKKLLLNFTTYIDSISFSCYEDELCVSLSLLLKVEWRSNTSKLHLESSSSSCHLHHSRPHIPNQITIPHKKLSHVIYVNLNILPGFHAFSSLVTLGSSRRAAMKCKRQRLGIENILDLASLRRRASYI